MTIKRIKRKNDPYTNKNIRIKRGIFMKSWIINHVHNKDMNVYEYHRQFWMERIFVLIEKFYTIQMDLFDLTT